MRVLIVPLVAVGVVLGGYTDEPSERQMRSAFEASLAEKVRNAMEFVSDTGGTEAVDKVRQAGTDRFKINGFQKRECARQLPGAGHICVFTVEIDLVNGALRGTMTGRFYSSPEGLAFASEA